MLFSPIFVFMIRAITRSCDTEVQYLVPGTWYPGAGILPPVVNMNRFRLERITAPLVISLKTSSIFVRSFFTQYAPLFEPGTIFYGFNRSHFWAHVVVPSLSTGNGAGRNSLIHVPAGDELIKATKIPFRRKQPRRHALQDCE